MSDRFQEETEDLLRLHGTMLRRTANGHELWALSGGQTVTIGNTGKGGGGYEPRAWKNALASVRRGLRAGGVELPKNDEVDMSDEKNEVGAVARVVRFSELGVHAQRKVRVYEKVEAEAVACSDALAVIFDLISAEERTKAQVTLLDGDGHEIEGPITVRVTIERERGSSGTVSA